MRNLVVRVTVAVSGFGVLAGGLLAATGQAQGPARPGVHLGRSSPVHLVRRVNVRGLPAPTHHPVISVEPNETAPVTRAPRTTGVVPLVRKKIGAPAGDASAAAVERSSVAGLSLNGHMPPDTQLAVSPSRVVEFVNDSAEVLDHSGTVLKTFDLGSLFSGKANTGTDPKIVYDSSSKDFFASYISKFSDDKASTVELAVTSDPTGNWFVYDVHDEGILQDQPKLGVSSDKLTMSWNDHGNSGPEEYIVIRKAGIVARAGTVPGTNLGTRQLATERRPGGAAVLEFDRVRGLPQLHQQQSRPPFLHRGSRHFADIVHRERLHDRLDVGTAGSRPATGRHDVHSHARHRR